MFVSQLSRNYPHHESSFERRTKASLVGDSLGGMLGDNLGKGDYESKMSRDNGETLLPQDIKMYRMEKPRSPEMGKISQDKRKNWRRTGQPKMFFYIMPIFLLFSGFLGFSIL